MFTKLQHWLTRNRRERTIGPAPDADSVEYFCADDDNDTDLEAAADAGELLPWRVDAEGRQWYRSLPTIHGVPGGANYEG